MRCVVTSDTHTHPFKACSQDGGRDRLMDGVSALEQTLKYAQQYACPWIHAGDLKVPKTFWPQEALNLVLNTLRAYPEVNKYMLPGNHGTGVNGTEVTPFDDIAHIYEAPTPVDVGGTGVLFLPWAKTYETFDPLNCSVVVGHAFLAGVFLGPDELRLPGIGHRLADFQLGPEGPVKLGIFGDVHTGQGFFRPAKRPPGWLPWRKFAAAAKWETGPFCLVQAPFNGVAVYPGSPYQQTFGEAQDWPKGCLLIDDDPPSITLLPVDGPRFHTVEWLDEPRPQDTDRWGGGFVRLSVGPWAETGGGQKLLQSLRTSCQARALQVILVRPPVSETRADLHAALSMATLLERYVEARPPKGLPAPAVLEAGKRLLGESA